MASSRRSANSPDDAAEPFPAFPASSSAQEETTTSVTTSTTTHTVIGADGDPVIRTTTTPAYPTGQAPPVVYTTDDPNTAPVPFTRTTVTVPERAAEPAPTPILRRRPIGIRRLPSSQNNRLSAASSDSLDGPSRSASGRRRSASAPQDPHLGAGAGGSTRLTRQFTGQSGLPPLQEESSQHLRPPGQTVAESTAAPVTVTSTTGVGRRRSISNAAKSIRSRLSAGDESTRTQQDYEDEVVDLLDIVDPEVQTLNTLTNVQNSLFVPDLGRWLNRRPTYTLSRAPTRISEGETPGVTPTVTTEPKARPADPTIDEEADGEPATMQRTWSWQRQPRMERSHSISSVLTDSHYAVLPHGVSLDDWEIEDKEALDDHVRHMLHSRRSKFKQRMRAFGKYIRKPLGFFVTLYATLITLFGLAWVLFLIGWIYAGDRNDYIIHIIDSVLVALFAIMGDGLAPFRAVDTYHMCFIANYGLTTWRVRREQNLPALRDQNEFPERMAKEADPEAANPKDAEFSVLNPEQQKRLVHHQSKFAKSHSFYKPHETTTHYAFPLNLLITIVVLLDCHSLLQISLGAFTWGWSYHTRPSWITAVILSLSITCNITAGIIISIGDRKTRKKDVIERMSRQDLTAQAIKKVKKHKADREGHHGAAHASENFEAIEEEQTNESEAARLEKTAEQSASR